MNLYYIRAAIRENTGQVLTFAKIRQLLLEEGLISQSEIDQNPMAKEFEGYGRYFYIPPYIILGLPFLWVYGWKTAQEEETCYV